MHVVTMRAGYKMNVKWVRGAILHDRLSRSAALESIVEMTMT